MITPGKRLQVSGREVREIRLFWLLGYTGDAIAGRMGRDRKTVNAAIHAGGLDRPEAPFEMAWLSLRREFDALAETMATGGDVERPQMLRLAAELRHTEAAMRAAGRGASDDTETEMDEAEDEDDVWERLEAVEQQRRLDAARLRAEGASETGAGLSRSGDAGLPETKSVPVRRAGYSGSAAGPMADMAVHGRTRRWEDKGGG
tara:strand:+ start:2348 stop:2956 length:609 start_codon:yes stop_codon:yes gene_type:complete